MLQMKCDRRRELDEETIVFLATAWKHLADHRLKIEETAIQLHFGFYCD